MKPRTLLLLAVALAGCGAKYPDGPPTITETGIAKGRTFLFRRVEMLRVGARTTTDTFVAEETLAEGEGNTVTAAKLSILDEGSREETGDVVQTLGWAAGQNLVVRAKGEGLEMWTLPEKTPLRTEVEEVVTKLYRGIGKEDPFLSNIPPRRLALRGPVNEYAKAVPSYLIGGKSGLFQAAEGARAYVVGIRDELVTVHVDVTLAHADKDCTFRANLRGEVTVRRHGGDLAHLEMKGPLSGTCDAEKTEGAYDLVIDRSPR